MNVYPVFESEVSNLSMLNNLVTGLFSAGFSFLLLAIGIIVDLLTADKLNWDSELNRLIIVVAIVFAMIAVISFVFGWWARNQRESIWDKIKKACREIPPR